MPEIAFCGRSECRQVLAAQRVDGQEGDCPRLGDAGAHAGIELFSTWAAGQEEGALPLFRLVDMPGLWFCQGPDQGWSTGGRRWSIPTCAGGRVLARTLVAGR